MIMNTKQQEKLNKIQQEVLDKIIVARVGLFVLNCEIAPIVTEVVFTGTITVGATLFSYDVALIAGISIWGRYLNRDDGRPGDAEREDRES